MKKTLLLLSAIAFVFTTHMAHAQIDNPGFETWTNDLLVPAAMNPNSGNDTYGWWDYNCFNSILIGSSPISVTRCTDTVYSGSYSVRLETKVYTPTSWNIYNPWGIPFIGHAYNDTLGILFNGKVNISNQTFIPGVAFTESISQFKFYYQYKPNGNDTAVCRVELVSGGTYVAGGIFKTNVATGGSGWQQAVVDLAYVNGLTPDTLYVLISASSLHNKPKAGSVLWIDEVSTTLATGVKKALEEGSTVTVFPNPTTGRITVDTKNIERIEVFNLQGKQVYIGKEKEIDLSQNQKGIYIIKVTADKQTITRKLIRR